MRRRAAGFAFRPLVSALVVIEQLDEIWAKATLRSVLGQCYPAIELIVVVPPLAKFAAGELARSYLDDKRVTVVAADREHGSAGGLLRLAAETARGEYVAFVGHGDRLAPDAIFRVVELLQDLRVDVVYTDEDVIDEFDDHEERVCKPYWCPDLLLEQPYVGGLCVLRSEPLATVLADLGRPTERGERVRVPSTS